MTVLKTLAGYPPELLAPAQAALADGRLLPLLNQPPCAPTARSAAASRVQGGQLKAKREIRIAGCSRRPLRPSST